MPRMNTDIAAPSTRNSGIDALRVLATLLVVLHHTAITYGAMGGWYYREIPHDGSASSLILMVFCTVNQAWFMGAFFLLAGYFTPHALQSKGPWRYLRDRLVRLGLPLLVYGFLIGPITVALAQTTRGRAFTDTLLGLWAQGRFVLGPLWFAWALLIFAVAAIGWHLLGRRQPAPDRPFPTNTTLLLAALATGAAAFVLRLQWPVGTEAAGLQLGYFASYVVLFVAGYMAASPRWLEHLPEAQVRTWRRVAWVALPVLPILAMSGIPGKPEGGWNVPAASYALWEPFIAWGVILGLLQYCQRRSKTLGPLGTSLARRAFAIYVIHPPIVVGVTVAWRSVDAPALLKFALSASVACLLCYVLAGLLLKLPGVRRVL